jgi:hypothetical protein
MRPKVAEFSNVTVGQPHAIRQSRKALQRVLAGIMQREKGYFDG